MKDVLALSHVRKSYDGEVVLADVTLAFLPGAKIGVVGPNGMGKSTLLRMMAGLDRWFLDRVAYRKLARARLEPRSEALQLVTYDGEHLGHVRREGPSGPDERWVAVLKQQARQVGTYGSAASAAAALAHACGKAPEEAS